MANEFTWEITEVNPDGKTMVVQYTTTATNETSTLNIPIPVATADMDVYVSRYKPATVVAAALATVVVGQSGVHKETPVPQAQITQQEFDAKIVAIVRQELAKTV